MKQSQLFSTLMRAFIFSMGLLASQLASANLLDVDDAFALQKVKVENDKLVLHWKIADGYYLYQKRVSVTSNDLTLQAIAFPKAKIKDDPIFGKTAVFFHNLNIQVPFQASTLSQATLTVKYQGCEKKQGVCYPPQTRQITVNLPTKNTTHNNTSSNFTSLANLNALLSTPSNNTLLPANQAFQLVTTQQPGKLVLDFKVAKGYHLYQDKIKVSIIKGAVDIGALKLPLAIEENDPIFGKVKAYHHDFQASLPLLKVGKSATIEISYQGCSTTSGVCYPPEHKKITLQASAANGAVANTTNGTAAANASNDSANLSETDHITQTLQHSSIWIVIGTFFVFGLLLSLTPCVFPMIPILSSIIVGQGANLTTRKAFTMSLVYVLAMSVTYTVAGVLAGIFGENLQIMFQNPWIIGSFAIIFIALAFSMFGFYELQLPSSLQSKLVNVSNNQKSGSYTGVAVMGFLSALIVGPCVAPPLAGALIYIGQTGDAFLGGSALFAMSIGMGLPLLAIGTSAGKFMPKAGAWMDNVKAVFGVMLLAIALWMAERILPGQISLLLWGILLIGSGVYLGALNSTEGKTGWQKLFKTSGLILFIYGAVVIIGASAGSKDLFQPLKVFQGSSTHATNQQASHVEFKTIKSLDDLNVIIAQGKPVMLDFYADWCISCKEMEKFTFTDSQVIKALKGVIVLQADVTANNAADKALMKHFNIIGPPAILFFNKGQEVKSQRVVGFKNAEDFMGHINNSFQ